MFHMGGEENKVRRSDRFYGEIIGRMENATCNSTSAQVVGLSCFGMQRPQK